MQENWLIYTEEIKVRTLKSEEMEEIRQLAVLGKKKLELDGSEEDLLAIDAIQTALSQFKEHELTAEEIEEISFEMGSLYGSLIEKKYGWTWIYIKKKGITGYCVVSEDKKFCCPVHNYVYFILTERNRTNNSKLLFNMLEVVHEEQVEDLYTFIT